jgi:glycine/D-amino acid oxidase-like deaminating enzyme
VTPRNVEIAVIGAGIVGLACAFYLALRGRGRKLVVIDPEPPMSLTSAASGENYRNWWPHPVMTAFTDYSIDLMEALSLESKDRFSMTRRGYALASRLASPDELLRELHQGYGQQGVDKIRMHEKGSASTYRPAGSPSWEDAPDGVDVIRDPELLRLHFPSFDKDVATILHVRRAGDISGQQLGSYMLEHVRAEGGALLRARLVEVERANGFLLSLEGPEGRESVRADILVNAAGPWVGAIAGMLGETLPVSNVFQQKIAFQDIEGAICGQMPFSIDLDGQVIDWTQDERAVLREEPATAWLTAPLPGGIHCRPQGGDHGKWIKLGWAFNRDPSAPRPDLPLDPNFPEIVLRAASRLNPKLKTYYGRLPRQLSHYGGYYTMTKENWPLIGPMRTSGAFVAGALSGFGTMAACATGALSAQWISGGELPEFARALSLSRYGDKKFMQELLANANTGVL